MSRAEEILQELANANEIVIMSIEEFLDIITSDPEDEQLELDLDNNILN